MTRPQSAAEERANCTSHGIGFVLAVAALPLLLHVARTRSASAAHTLALAAFPATMMLLYLSSALFHGLPAGRAKRFFERLDRAAIHLFIAGSYSAFAAPALHGPRAWLLLALVWALALLGVLVTLRNALPQPLWSTGLYVALGWLAVLAALPWVGQLDPACLSLLLAGSLTYTLGAGLFLLSARFRFAHLVWHLFVMAGSGLHFMGIAQLA